ncbi:hypothetical protein AOLI_G00195420 [Acnodon oligacanthus]
MRRSCKELGPALQEKIMLSQKRRKKATSHCKVQTTWVRTSWSPGKSKLSQRFVVCWVKGCSGVSLTHRLTEETPDLQLLKGQLGIEILSSTASSPNAATDLLVAAGKDLLAGAMWAQPFDAKSLGSKEPDNYAKEGCAVSFTELG